MPSREAIRIDSALDLNTARDRLTDAFRDPRIRDRLFPTRIHLRGEVTPNRVVLYRHRGGRFSYARFEGTLNVEGDRTLLLGHFVRHRPNFGHLFGAFMLALSVFAVVLAIAKWQGTVTLLVVLIGVVLGSVAVAVIRFSSRNIDAEIGLLRSDIQELLGRSGV